MLIKKFFFLLCGLLLTLEALKASPQIPSDFTYKGTPVGPECLLPFVNSKTAHKIVVLKGNACQEKQQSYNPENLKKGFIGYAIKWSGRGMQEPYVFYKYLGKIPSKDVKAPYDLLEVQWSDGSTGSFSGLFVVEKIDQELRLVQILDQGDRCFGSVHDASLANGILTYNKQVTSQGLFDLLYSEKKANKNESIFEDCAVCCIGNVTFQGGKVEGINFTINAQDVKNKLTQENNDTPQGCFDALLLERLESGKTTLLLDDLQELGRKIKEQCVAH